MSSYLDVSLIEELDPSLADGRIEVYNREIALEITNEGSSEGVNGETMEPIKVRILVLGSLETPASVEVEFSSEADLFFYFNHKMDEDDFQHLQSSQKLVLAFSGYANFLIKLFNSIIAEPTVNFGVMCMSEDSSIARLDFVQNVTYKYLELFTCSMERTTEEVTQRNITYRYNMMKQKMLMMQSRLTEMSNTVKLKNPSLLLHMQNKNAQPGNGVGQRGSGLSPRAVAKGKRVG